MHVVRTPKSPEPDERTSDDLGALVEAVLAGNREAAHQLFDAVAPIFLRAARSTLGAHHPEVEDFVQDASLRFFRSLEGFRGEAKVRRYAYRIGCNVAADWIRAATTQKRARIDVEYSDDARSRDNPAQALHRRRLGALLIDTLSQDQLRCFLLWNVVGCSVTEIADETSTPVNTVRSRLRLAREAIRRKLKDDPTLLRQWEGT